MPTFGFDKPIDDIEPAVLVPEEWYTFVIACDPEISKNGALREIVGDVDDGDPVIEEALAENKKAGYNLVINLELVSDDPSFNGREMTLWLPWPSAKDHESHNRRGQTNYDAKMQRIVEFVEAFGGAVDGENITLQKDLQGMCYVVQRQSQSGPDLENSIDMFQGFGTVE